MSYLEKLKKNPEIKSTTEITKPGWVILNKKNLFKQHNTNEDKTQTKENISVISGEIQNEENENQIIDIKREHYENFYIKYGSLLLDFFMDMKDEFENNCYNILDNKEYGEKCFSYDFERFVFKNIKMIKEEDNENNSMGSEEEEDYHF